MTARVLLFASYAEALGREEVAVEAAPGATVGDVLRQLRALPGSACLPTKPLVAVNARYATLLDAVHPGDEVAFIPPVAGG